MTNRNLGRQWFHGSPEDLNPGDVIQPTSVTGKRATRGDSSPDHVYVTPHAFVAGQYTWKFGDDGKLADDPKQGPSGHVYEVEPQGRTLKDKNVPRHAPDGISYTAKAAVVKRRLDPEEWR